VLARLKKAEEEEPIGRMLADHIVSTTISTRPSTRCCDHRRRRGAMPAELVRRSPRDAR
jgi:hypothetical protein